MKKTMLKISLIFLLVNFTQMALSGSEQAQKDHSSRSVTTSQSRIKKTDEERSLQQLSTYLSAYKSFESNFVQQSKNEQDEVIQTLTGRLIIQKPKQFFWQADEPAAQLLVSDGQSIWHFDEDLEQVIIQKYGAHKQQSPLLLIFEDAVYIREHFVLERHEKLDQNERFHLLPKQNDENNPIKAVTLDFKQQQLQSLLFVDALRQITEISFAQVSVNKQYDDDQFHFVIPASADVLYE